MINLRKVNASKIAFFTLGISDICLGLILLSTIILLQGVSFPFLLGIQYLIFGAYLCKGKIIKKLLVYGITIFSVLSALIFIMMGLDKEVPAYYKTPISVQIVIIGGIILALMINCLFLMLSKKLLE